MGILKIILGIAIPIIVLIIMIPVLLSNTSSLIHNNQELASDVQTFTPQFEQDLTTCSTTTGQTLTNCKELINAEKGRCDPLGNPPVCNDPRINEILSANRPNPIFGQPTSFTTYINSRLDFSIDYPSNWVADENPIYGIVGIKDKMTAPNALFEIKQIQNNGNSFDYMLSKYLSDVGVVNGDNFKINLQSQDKITIGNKDAYRIHYTMTIGSALCNDEDYLINGGNFVTAISFNNCDQDNYAQIMPTYEKVVSTFR